MSSPDMLSGEGILALGTLLGLGMLVALGEVLRHWGISGRTTRRLVHVGVSLFVAATPFLFVRPSPVYGLAAVFVVLNTGARSADWWTSIHESRPQSWGTVALPLSVLPALAATWSVSPDRIFAFQIAYLVLGVADPVASWVGERKMEPEAQSEDSTVAGSLAFAGTTAILTTAALIAQTSWAVDLIGIAVIGTTLVATCVEGVSRRGWDNMFIVCAVVLILVPLQTGVWAAMHLAGSLGIGAAFGGIAYWMGGLNSRGAATASLFATSLVGLGGWAWIVPGIVFFGLSSAVTAMEFDGQSTSEGGSPLRRTQAQVLANGGVAWVALAVVAVAPEGLSGVSTGGYAAFVGALSAAAADTWATELGRLSPRPPWSLRSFCRVSRGTSGAVSLVGSIAATFGAVSVVGAALLVNGPLSGNIGRDTVLLVGAGVGGMLIDSGAGAYLQAKYRTASGEWTERPPGPEADPVCGWAGVGNNAVNLVGTAAGAVLALLGILFFG